MPDLDCVVIHDIIPNEGRTTMGLRSSNIKQVIAFTLPLIIRLKEGDRVYFVACKQLESPPEDSREIRITHEDYRFLRMYRKDEKDEFLTLTSRDMQVLKTIKDRYGH